MKKQLLVLITIIVVSTLLLSGCSIINSDKSVESDNIIFGTNLVKYDLEGMGDFGFNLNMISPSKKTKVEFVSFTGKNTQGLAVKLADDTFDSIKNLKYNGYYLKLLGFICNTGDSSVVITGVNLKVDGKDRTLTFETPIKHNVREDDLTSVVQIRNYPLFISTNSYAFNMYSFEYYVESDVTIENFDFNNFLTITNADIYVNGKYKGRTTSVFPLELKKGTIFSITGNLAFKNNEDITNYESIYCDSLLTYTTNGVQKTVRSNLVSQSVSNEDDAKKVINLLLE